MRADTEVAVTRPRRWDAPLDERMRSLDVDHLLRIAPFNQIDPTQFPTSLPLHEILRNDARLVRCLPGDLIVREGDYGHSAFLILLGNVRIVLAGLSGTPLGRQAPRQLGWWDAIAQLWKRPRLPEVRSHENATTETNQFSDPTGWVAQRRDDSGPRIFLMDVPRVLEHSKTAVLGPGELFGELAALTRSPRTATAFAEGEATLVEIRWQGLRDLMRYTPAIRQHVERVYRENSLLVHLRETPLLAELPDKQLAAVADATQFESYGQFDWNEKFDPTIRRRRGDAIVDEPLIVEEGSPCDAALLLKTGFARLSHRHGHGHRTVAYLGRGQAFGWAEAIAAAQGADVAWSQSLRALGYVDVLRIDAEAIRNHILPFVEPGRLPALTPPVLPASFRASSPNKQDPTIAAATIAAQSSVDQGWLEFLVERRFINGREAMVIDLDRCTRCDDCVRACAATHDNNPRFVREGPRHGSWQIAQACMHCVDPVCMIGCPTGAVGRESATGILRINDNACIGCGTCAISCPYDNIRMVEIRNAEGRILIDRESRQPIAKATKCDLCVDQPGGPACQRACPHDALVRLDLSDLTSVIEWAER